MGNQKIVEATWIKMRETRGLDEGGRPSEESQRIANAASGHGWGQIGQQSPSSAGSTSARPEIFHGLEMEEGRWIC